MTSDRVLVMTMKNGMLDERGRRIPRFNLARLQAVDAIRAWARRDVDIIVPEDAA